MISTRRYKMCWPASGIRMLEQECGLLREYGRTPRPLIRRSARRSGLGSAKPLQDQYADTLPPQLDEAKKKLGDLAESEEDVLSYLGLPEILQRNFCGSEGQAAAHGALHH